MKESSRKRFVLTDLAVHFELYGSGSSLRITDLAVHFGPNFFVRDIIEMFCLQLMGKVETTYIGQTSSI